MTQQCGEVQMNFTQINCSSINHSRLGTSASQVTVLEKIVELYIISILCVFGFIGNCIAVVVLRRDNERREALFLLQALALADAFYLLVAILRYPFKYLIHNEKVYFSMQLVVFPLLKTAQAMTIWMILLVTTDRYIYVCRPLVAHQLCNSRTRRILSILVFVFAFIYNIPRFFDSCVWTFKDVCTGNSYSRMIYSPAFPKIYFPIYQYAGYLLLLYVGPLTILVILNYKLLSAIRRSRRRQRQCTLQPASQQVIQSETNASIVLLIVVIVFVVCETPELVLKIIIIITRHTSHLEKYFTKSMLHTCTTLSELLMVVNSSINFLIYCAFGQRFRHIMKETFKRTNSHTTMLTHESVPLDVFKHGNHHVRQNLNLGL